MLEGNEAFDLVQAALWVAAEDYPELDVPGEVERAGLIAKEAANRAGNENNPFARLDLVRGYLFEELGFRGDVDDCDDPRRGREHPVHVRRRCSGGSLRRRGQRRW